MRREILIQTEPRYIRQSKSLLSYFVHDIIPNGALPVYDFNSDDSGDLKTIIHNNSTDAVISYPKSDRLTLSLEPYSCQELEHLAWEVLLAATFNNKCVKPDEAERFFGLHDLPLNDFVCRYDHTIAVTNPEFLGIFAEQNNKFGLCVFNKYAVVGII